MGAVARVAERSLPLMSAVPWPPAAPVLLPTRPPLAIIRATAATEERPKDTSEGEDRTAETMSDEEEEGADSAESAPLACADTPRSCSLVSRSLFSLPCPVAEYSEALLKLRARGTRLQGRGGRVSLTGSEPASGTGSIAGRGCA